MDKIEALIKKLADLKEELKKNVKADSYDPKVHKYPGNRPDMTEHQEAHHAKLFNNANSNAPLTGVHSGGEEHSDNHTASAHHYLKTGKALKFPTPEHANIKERQHFRLPSISGAATKLKKNVNMSYSKPANVSPGSLSMAEKADIVKPDTGFGATTVKDTSSTPVPAADPAHPYGKVIMKDDCAKAEYLSLFKNGQWDIKKSFQEPTKLDSESHTEFAMRRKKAIQDHNEKAMPGITAALDRSIKPLKIKNDIPALKNKK